MFEQLTWSLGMFVQAAFLILGLVFVLRHTEIIQILIFQPEKRNSLSMSRRMLTPAIVVAGLYLCIVGMLWLIYGETDTTAIDWAVVVLLIGVLIVGPAAGCLATAIVAPVRAIIVFFKDADDVTIEGYAQQPYYFLDNDFWQTETWIWHQPEVVQLLIACLAGSVAFWLYRQKQHTDYPLYVGIPLALAIQGAYVMTAIAQWGYEHGHHYMVTEAGPSAVALSVAILLFVMTMALARTEYERKRTQAAELAAAQDQLRFLNAQINPHFLNNALNAIGGVMEQSPDKARNLLGDLGDYFRTMCSETEAMTTVSNEMDTVRQYLALEQARFGERLVVNIDIAPNCLQLLIPRMVLQPLVENAIRHGVEKKAGQGVVNLTGRLDNSELIFTVADNGKGLMKTLTPDDYGVGLSNVYTRLSRVYDKNMTFEVSGVWGGGATSTISLKI